MVEGSEALQKLACEADAIPRLHESLSNTNNTEPWRTRLVEGALLALAALCSVREASRKQVGGA